MVINSKTESSKDRNPSSGKKKKNHILCKAFNTLLFQGFQGLTILLSCEKAIAIQRSAVLLRMALILKMTCLGLLIHDTINLQPRGVQSWKHVWLTPQVSSRGMYCC